MDRRGSLHIPIPPQRLEATAILGILSPTRSFRDLGETPGRQLHDDLLRCGGIQPAWKLKGAANDS